MKLVPFLISTIVAIACLALAAMHYYHGSANLRLQVELQKEQQSLQGMRDTLEEQQREFQRQQQIIDEGVSVQQRLGPPIVQNIGVIAARNNNEKLKILLGRYKLEAAIPNAEQLKQIEEQLRQSQSKGTPTTGGAR
jgi:hypothetical protein